MDNMLKASSAKYVVLIMEGSRIIDKFEVSESGLAVLQGIKRQISI